MRGKFIVLEGIDGSGKTTIAKRLVEEYKKDNQEAWYISVSDCVKQGTSISIIKHNDLPAHTASNQMSRDDIPEVYKEIFNQDLITKIDTAAKGVREALLNLENIHTTYLGDGNIHYVKAYFYNLLFEAYLNLMVEISLFIEKIRESGITVIADRWISSTIAYNGIVKKTYISKAMKYFIKYYSSKARRNNRFYIYDNVMLKYIDNSISSDHSHIYKDRYKDIMKYIISKIYGNVNTLKPYIDLEIFLMAKPKVTLNRIKANRKATELVFETEEKLDRVYEVYKRIRDEYKLLEESKNMNLYVQPHPILINKKVFIDIHSEASIEDIFNIVKKEVNQLG